MHEYHSLITKLTQDFANLKIIKLDGLDTTVEIDPANLFAFLRRVRDDEHLLFEQLVDLCGVDYALYGKDEWDTQNVTTDGFSRGVKEPDFNTFAETKRFAVVYHLLSLRHNQRLRVRCFMENTADDLPIITSVVELWASANWYEREAFDLFGILFDNHPDLRRILTDYGFIGYPFRKDFPLIGKVEVKYDEQQGRVAYQPVSIEPRVLVPKVIRKVIENG